MYFVRSDLGTLRRPVLGSETYIGRSDDERRKCIFKRIKKIPCRYRSHEKSLTSLTHETVLGYLLLINYQTTSNVK